jgi:hypothetical protein
MPKIAEFSWEELEYSTGGSGGTGGTGTPGLAATIKVGTVVSGDTASVTNVGTSNDAVFNFVLPKGADANTSVIQSLQSDVQNVKNTLKSVDKYSEYEERYVAFNVSELPGNSTFKQINFARTFSTIPFIQITLDIQDQTARIPYYANVTTTGFQVTSNYGAAVKGVWYKAYVK